MSFNVRINQTPSAPIGVTRTTFLVTINTQKAFTDPDRAAAAKGAVSEMVSEILADFGYYLKMYRPETVDGQKSYVQVELDQGQIRDGDADARFEIGGKFHKMHVHAKVSFEHDIGYGFQVDLKKLRGDLPVGFHLDVKYLRDASANATRYIHKAL